MKDLSSNSSLSLESTATPGSTAESQGYDEQQQPTVLEAEEFTVVLSKTTEGDCVGLDVDIAKKTFLVVEKVNGGAAGAWNEGHLLFPDLQIQVGDEIMSINGATSCDAMRDVCKSD